MSLGLVRNYADGKLSPDEESFDLFQDVLNQNRRTKCRTEAAVALDSHFFATLPILKEVSASKAEMAWLIYDLVLDPTSNTYRLQRTRIVYTIFESALITLTSPI